MHLEIRLCGPQDGEPQKVGALVSLINSVYAAAEKGMWKPHFQRVQVPQVEAMIRQQQLLLAFWGDTLVGCVFVTTLNPETGEFGMLVCDPSHRNKGIGKALIQAAEDRCRDAGCQYMQLELLYPRDWPQATKEILKQWYPLLGYQKGSEADFGQYYPELVPMLATDCVFSVYRKSLSS